MIVAERHVGPVYLQLERRGDALYLLASIGAAETGWEGVASFPPGTDHEAYEQLERVETPNDLEDLVRAWSDERTWGSFQEFRNLYGF